MTAISGNTLTLAANDFCGEYQKNPFGNQGGHPTRDVMWFDPDKYGTAGIYLRLEDLATGSSQFIHVVSADISLNQVTTDTVISAPLIAAIAGSTKVLLTFARYEMALGFELAYTYIGDNASPPSPDMRWL